eukprot:CAMPEP_0178705110 /NCGR_PEP_ID=MMETSP0699-20121125/14595_1 /TAXON_ID=265572 /ORGANISM="Extubocellulus spinifer, Strain CCMP396" /LENGTH=137 /DNA_ID=CAMNT_0020352615 /DNA_START=252 /DNA_END=662 /DNA_ORIENTATION=+
MTRMMKRLSVFRNFIATRGKRAGVYRESPQAHKAHLSHDPSVSRPSEQEQLTQLYDRISTVRDALRRIGVEDSDSDGTSQTHQAHDPVDEAYEYWDWADHTHEERLNHFYDRISTVRDALCRICVEDSDSESTGSEE